MNPWRRTVGSTALPAAVTLFLMLAPCASARASAQTASEADRRDGNAGNAGNDGNHGNDESSVAPRGGLGWTGIGLMSAGGFLLLGSFTFNDSKGCGFFNELACRDVGRVYGTTGGVMVITGLAFLIKDDYRRHPKGYPKPTRQTGIAIGPRAIQVRMSF